MTEQAIEDQSFARMIGLEALAIERLEATSKAALVVVKSATSFEGALTTIESALAEAVLAIRSEVRDEATKQFAAETGILVTASGTNDGERAQKAAAAYGKAWTKALAESPAEWALAIEQAREACSSKLEGIASYEVVHAWNDEHRLNGKAAGVKVGQIWRCKEDNSVCTACEDLDGTAAGPDGKFPGGPDGEPVGWPPLHFRCRCIVVTGSAKAAAEEERDMDGIVVKDSSSSSVPSLALVETPSLLTRHFEIKGFDLQKRTADFVASTGVVDAHDEIVDQGTWILDDYLKNPVVLFAHQSRELPIGKSLDVQIVNGPRGPQLENRVEFCTEEMNPLAEKVWKMIVAKFLRAVSVGFVPRSYRYEMRDGVEVWVWADCVLKEISVTPVPANPEALAKMKSLALGTRSSSEQIPSRAQVRAAKSLTPSAPADGSTPTTETKKEEHSMSDAEKALQAQIEKNHLAIAELKLEAKNATEIATKATTEKAALEGQIKSLTTEKTALEAQAKTLGEDRDAQKARAEKAEGQLVELEVEAQIGPGGKIQPAEKEMFVELRKTNPELFAKMLAQRSPMNLGAPVIAGVQDEQGVARSLDPKDAVLDVAAEATRLGGG